MNRYFTIFKFDFYNDHPNHLIETLEGIWGYQVFRNRKLANKIGKYLNHDCRL